MLRFIGTTVTGVGGQTSDILQYVDLEPFAEYVEAGRLSALLRGKFNRVAGNEQTDTEFLGVLAAHAGLPDLSPGQASSLIFDTSAVITDGDAATWENFSVELTVPPLAKFLQVTLAAVENVLDNSTGVELDGHFADEASLVVYIRGDFDFDATLSAADIDQLSRTIRLTDYNRLMDLNRDGVLDPLDRKVWVENLKKTTYGDANLDGQFNTKDLIQMFEIGEYEDGMLGNSGWAEGDFNGDTDFASNDLVLALQTGAYELGAAHAVAVPEPSGLSLLVAGALWVVLSRRKAVLATVV
jgi:hypothetical protein